MKIIRAIKTYNVVLATFAGQLVLMALFHLTLLLSLQQWLSSSEHSSIAFWLLFFALCIPLLSLGILSSTLLALMSGYFIGWESLYYYIPCYVASSYIGYKIIAFIDRGKTIQLLQHSNRLKKALLFLEIYPFLSVLFLRLSPIISFGQLTALCSFIRLNIMVYLSASALGMIPRTLLAIWCGLYINARQDSLTDYQLPENYTPFIIALFLVSLAGILYVVRRSFSAPKVLP